MKLRTLKLIDAPFMLEWMHDKEVVKYLQADFGSKTIEDCRQFIIESISEKENIHLAIVDETDCYMGTVSLKNIEKKTAEFAITVRRKAMGGGYAGFAMEEILKKGFEEIGLEKIYWYVSPENVRAIRFYDKNAYHRVSVSELPIRKNILSPREEYIWYQQTVDYGEKEIR